MPDLPNLSPSVQQIASKNKGEAAIDSVYIYNPPVDETGNWRATHTASEKCVDGIFNEVRAGYGFVPLLGAGFSVSAGIPIIKQLTSYLRRCICVALGVDKDTQANDGADENNVRQLWDPRTDTWPPLVDRKRPEHFALCLRQLLQAELPIEPQSLFGRAVHAMFADLFGGYQTKTLAAPVWALDRQPDSSWNGKLNTDSVPLFVSPLQNTGSRIVAQV